MGLDNQRSTQWAWKTWPQGVADRALFSGSQQMVHSGRIAVAMGGDGHGCDGQGRVVRCAGWLNVSCQLVFTLGCYFFEIEMSDEVSHTDKITLVDSFFFLFKRCG